MSGRFDYVKYDAQAVEDQKEAKTRCETVEKFVDTLPNGRAKSLALTALEETYMWIGKAIRDEQLTREPLSELQEQRTNS